MAESFGARLRQQREDRQIDLIAISEQTKIKLALLEAVEQDDVSHWPSGIFRRAYIRAYAQFIGLDPDAVVREFLEVHPDPGDAIVATAANAAAAEEEYAKNAPSMRLRHMMGSALGSLTRLRRPNTSESRPIAPEPDLPADVGIRGAEEDRSAWTSFHGLAAAAAGEPVQSHAELDAEPAPLVTAESTAPPPSDSPRVSTAAAVTETPEHESTLGVSAAAPRSDGEVEHQATLETVARLCTELGRVVDRDAVRQLLRETAAALTATGLIVWLWDDIADGLMPGLVHGYADRVLAQLPAVPRDADNATAAAFRTQAICEVAPSEHTSAAVVVPLLVPDGCAGVFAIELQPGVRPTRSLRAVATLLAAALTQLIHRSRPAERPAHVERMASAVAQFRPVARPIKVRR